MSDVAASGGYYIAMPAHAIVARAVDPDRIDRRGAHEVRDRRHAEEARDEHGGRVARASTPTCTRRSDRSRPRSARAWRRTCRPPTTRSSRKRRRGATPRPSGSTRSAQGRVWTGRQAKEIGLVDELGGLDRAIAIAKQRAKIAQDTDVELVIYPPKKSIYEMLSDPLGELERFVNAGVAARVQQPESHAGAGRAATGLPPRRAAGADAERLRSLGLFRLKGGNYRPLL